ncbi:hypothetical protein [Brevundimonas intermedia]|uniref:hypothetical protein n=1 Tax=Brevundimonas intermedia TaxID=74315 RepID=UPI0032093720
MVLAFAMPALAQDAAVVSDNPEMAAILASDQAVRQDLSAVLAGGRAYAERMIAEDAIRREQVRALLEAGALRTGADFHAAAFVFQHGSMPDDYLLAHSLALAAVAKGSTESTWIAAATLDRYLQMTGKPQIYGTQTTMRRGQPPTRDPYDHVLVPESLLIALGVPTKAREEASKAAQGASTTP